MRAAVAIRLRIADGGGIGGVAVADMVSKFMLWNFAIVPEANIIGKVANLVGNAVRHNPRGCSIAASVRVKPGIFGSSIGMRCIVEIRDDGVGFGADELSLLKRRPGRDMPEHGLGLVIVRRIARRTRTVLQQRIGRIRLPGRAPGAGAISQKEVVARARGCAGG